MPQSAKRKKEKPYDYPHIAPCPRSTAPGERAGGKSPCGFRPQRSARGQRTPQFYSNGTWRVPARTDGMGHRRHFDNFEIPFTFKLRYVNLEPIYDGICENLCRGGVPNFPNMFPLECRDPSRSHRQVLCVYS